MIPCITDRSGTSQILRCRLLSLSSMPCEPHLISIACQTSHHEKSTKVSSILYPEFQESVEHCLTHASMDKWRETDDDDDTRLACRCVALKLSCSSLKLIYRTQKRKSRRLQYFFHAIDRDNILSKMTIDWQQTHRCTVHNSQRSPIP